MRNTYQVTVHEDTELYCSPVLNVFGEPYMLFKPRQPIGFDLTRKKNDASEAHRKACVSLQKS
jgi:hypothetical protein